MNYKINDIIFFNEKEYGKILEVKRNERYCFDEIVFQNFITNKKDHCYSSDLRHNKDNKIVYHPTGI